MCLVIALSQMSRECEKRPDKRGQLERLRDSGEITAGRRCVIFLPREASTVDALPRRTGAIDMIVRRTAHGGSLAPPMAEPRSTCHWH